MNNIIIITSLFALSISFSEITYHLGYPNYITRTTSHIAASLVSLLLPVFFKDDLSIVVIVGVFFSIIMYLSKELKLLKGMYKHNSEGVGPYLFPIGLTIAAISFWDFQPYIFQMGCLVLGFSDPMAGVIGKTYGKLKYQLVAEKTLEGSAVFFITTVIIFAAMLGLYQIPLDLNHFSKIAVASGVLTLAEASFGNGWDNLVLPMFAGFVSVWVFI